MARVSLSDLLSFLNCGFSRLSFPFYEPARLPVIHAVCACARDLGTRGRSRGDETRDRRRGKNPDNSPEVIQVHALMRMTGTLWLNAWAGWSLLIQFRRPNAASTFQPIDADTP